MLVNVMSEVEIGTNGQVLGSVVEAEKGQDVAGNSAPNFFSCRTVK